MNYKSFGLYVEVCGKHLKQATRKQYTNKEKEKAIEHFLKESV